MAHAVEVAGVEQGDAGIECGVDGGDALAAVGRAVEVRHAHAAEADKRDGWTCRAEFALFHGGSPRNRWRVSRRDDEADMRDLDRADKLDNHEWLVHLIEQ